VQWLEHVEDTDVVVADLTPHASDRDGTGNGSIHPYSDPACRHGHGDAIACQRARVCNHHRIASVQQQSLHLPVTPVPLRCRSHAAGSQKHLQAATAKTLRYRNNRQKEKEKKSEVSRRT